MSDVANCDCSAIGPVSGELSATNAVDVSKWVGDDPRGRELRWLFVGCCSAPNPLADGRIDEDNSSECVACTVLDLVVSVIPCGVTEFVFDEDA